ncbi:AMP-binding enzyme protein, partial [Pseudomonas amygdali pv. tabaci]
MLNGSSAHPLRAANEMDRMNWLNLEHLLLDALPDRPLTLAPTLDHAQFRDQALSVAAGLQARGVKNLA